MFEDFDDDDDFEMSELEEWYDDHYQYFRRSASPETAGWDGVPLDVAFFYDGVYKPVKQEIAIQIRKLANKQYPLIESENRPGILSYINWAVENAGDYLMLSLWELVQDQKEGINLREKYPKFEEWVSFYARPKEPPAINYSFADFNPEFRKQISEEIIQQVAEESLKEELKYYHKTEQLKKEFYDAIQPIVLNRFKALEDLDYEGWVMFSVFIREEYERYLIRFDHVETVIDYGLDEEDINLDHEHFMEKLSIKMEERRENEQKSESSK